MGRSTQTCTMKGVRAAGVLAASVLLLAGCSIRNDVPDFRYPSQVKDDAGNWPELAVTRDLVAAGEDVSRDPQAVSDDNDRFESRVRRLRARAAALRRANGN